jgi:hypothetical protein
MSAPPRRLSLKLGALLCLIWLVSTVVIVWMGLPFVAAKIALGACALVWAVHVICVVWGRPRP